MVIYLGLFEDRINRILTRDSPSLRVRVKAWIKMIEYLKYYTYPEGKFRSDSGTLTEKCIATRCTLCGPLIELYIYSIFIKSLKLQL